jgi:hypothetical protein
MLPKDRVKSDDGCTSPKQQRGEEIKVSECSIACIRYPWVDLRRHGWECEGCACAGLNYCFRFSHHGIEGKYKLYVVVWKIRDMSEETLLLYRILVNITFFSPTYGMFDFLSRRVNWVKKGSGKIVFRYQALILNLMLWALWYLDVCSYCLDGCHCCYAMLTRVYSSCIEVRTSLYMVETRRASSPRTWTGLNSYHRGRRPILRNLPDLPCLADQIPILG